ncbi:MAG: spermidine/putrescine ABC transporter substrate-binding protein [Rhizobiales bacterium]|nr:spermidine/putrescine ABC transporter substrate-binding protein [Hyphomicrobiales bacterium]MBI3673469.1 spermidine/putrescine ABC transporter substrate-binding protein [Hyphomicrobiales bacterium]
MKLKAFATAAIAAVAIAASATAALAEKLVISNWDGYMPKDMAEKFKAATGIDLEIAVHATNEEIMGKVTASGGEGFDVLFVSSPFAEALNKLGLLAPIDHAKVPNLANLYPEATKLQHDPGNAYSVPYTWGTTGLCYRSDKVKAEPTSWNALLKPADDLKGKITMLATDRWLMAAGFLAEGLSVNTADQASLDKVRDRLIDTKRQLLAYDDTTFFSKLVSGEALLVQAWDGWCNYGIAENPAIKYVIPQEGSDLWVDTIVITKASKNPEAAHKFIDFVLNADNGKWVVENIMYKTPNKAGMDLVDKAMLEKYPNMAIAPADLLKYEQLRDLGGGMKAFSKTVSEIMAAK